MTRAVIRIAMCAALVCLTAGVAVAQTTTSSTQTKKFQIIAVDGNTLVVKLPEGTRELTVADDFRFNVDGKQLSVRELKAGMAGTANITTTTTVTPVVVTEVKEGTVVKAMGTSIIVRPAAATRCSRRVTSTSAGSRSCATAESRRSPIFVKTTS